MALLAGKVVNGMDFDEENYAEAKAQFLRLIDELDSRYANSELLFDARAAVMSSPVRKMDMYVIAQSLTRLARKDKPSVAERLAKLPGMAQLQREQAPALMI